MNVKIKRQGEFNGRVFLDVVVNDLITIRGCKIVSAGNGGTFVAMPSQKGKDEKWHDHVRFETRELQDEFSRLVIRAWRGEPEKAEEQVVRPNDQSPTRAPGQPNWDE